jgi:membrane-associated phospholipid phosphatase
MNVSNRWITFFTRPWVIGIYIILCILTYNYLDKPLATQLKLMDLSVSMPFLTWLTNFGLGLVYLALLLCGALISRYILKNSLWENRFWFLWWCIAFSGGICLVLKTLLGRARPSLWFQQEVWGFYGFHLNSNYWSLPSGHTTNVMALVFGLCYLFPRGSLLFIFTGLSVAFSRILLVQHYLTDVLAAL